MTVFSGDWYSDSKIMYALLDTVDFYKCGRTGYFDDFPYTQVQMNKNFPCPPHIDGTNVGESILIGYGDYTGGEINIEKKEPDRVLRKDIRRPLGITFNGSLYKHWVSPFTCAEGSNRYSLVFFNSSYNQKKKVKQ